MRTDSLTVREADDMSIFTDFVLNGFKQKDLAYYSPGTLYEVLSKLGEKVDSENKKANVNKLMSGWSSSTEVFEEQGIQVPAYALEVHACIDKGHPQNGYGTYVFIPDERKRIVLGPLKSIFSNPKEIYDDEDPVKMLSSIYADDEGFSTNQSLTIYELSCKKEDFYPLNIWDKKFANDMLEEIFSVFDNMQQGEFGGVSFVVIPPEPNWEVPGKMRIRYIEDPEYEEEIGLIETVKRTFTGKELPPEEVARLAGYRKQQLDTFESEEIKAIRKKMDWFVFRTTIRVYGSSKQIADDIAGIIMQKAAGKWNSLHITNKNGNLRDLAMRKEGSNPFLMSSEEIALLWHVPDEETTGDALHKPLPEAMRPPNNLITLDIGGPGDIRKMIASVG